MRTFTKSEIEQLKAVLADSNVRISIARTPKAADWITERERLVRAACFKAQSAFWKSTQLRLLKLRRQLSPEYEAFITRSVPYETD
jgi:hypothetical protein